MDYQFRKNKNNSKSPKKHKYCLPSQKTLKQISKILLRQIDEEMFEKKYAKVSDVLRLVGAGFFLGASVVSPNLPKAIAPFLKRNKNEYEVWKQFNIPYLKRTLKRLEDQKLIEINEHRGKQIVKITKEGQTKILKFALVELTIKKPKHWDGTWWLVSYDIPKGNEFERDILREYLKSWGFYPFQESVFLHAYPCFNQVEFLREYLEIGEYVRIIEVSKIENDKPFKEFFGV